MDHFEPLCLLFKLELSCIQAQLHQQMVKFLTVFMTTSSQIFIYKNVKINRRNCLIVRFYHLMNSKLSGSFYSMIICEDFSMHQTKQDPKCESLSD